MGFLKRLFGGGEAPGERLPGEDAPEDVAPDGPATASGRASGGGAASAIDEEQARDRELLREEARRLDDELLQRQLRYADRSWTPPPQGGSRRSAEASLTPRRACRRAGWGVRIP